MFDVDRSFGKAQGNMFKAPHMTIVLLLGLFVCGCSGDSARVSLSNNSEIVSDDGRGFAIEVGATSADGSTESSGEGGGAVTKYSLDVTAAGSYELCLSGDDGNSSAYLADDSGRLKIAVVGLGCGESQLEEGRYGLQVVGAHDVDFTY